MDWLIAAVLAAGPVIVVVALALRDRRQRRRWDAQRLVGRTSERRVAYGAAFRDLSTQERRAAYGNGPKLAMRVGEFTSSPPVARHVYPPAARIVAKLTTEELRARAERPWWERYDHLAHERPRERAVDPSAFFVPPLLSVMGGCPCCEDRPTPRAR